MKRFFMNMKSYVVATLILATMSSTVVSCTDAYDDTKVWEEIDKIKEELAQLRADVANEINAIKALIDGSITVEEVVANDDGSTEVKLSDGTSLMVYPDRGEHPKNIITVKEKDGVMYWAIYNERGGVEFIYNDSGERIPVVDVKPQVRANDNNGTIEVSFDGGNTWHVTGYTPSTSDSMITGVKVVYSEWQTDNNGKHIPLYCELTLADGNTIKVGMRGGKIILSVDTIFAPYGTDRTFYITAEDAADYLTEVPAGWGCNIKFRETNSAYEMVFKAPTYEAITNGSAVAEGTFKMMIVFNDGTSAIARIHLTTEPVKIKFIDETVRMEAGYGCDYMLYGMVSTFNQETLTTNINRFLNGETIKGIYEVGFFETTTAEVAIADIFTQKLVAGREYTFWYAVPRYDEEGTPYVLTEEVMSKIYKHGEVSFEVTSTSFFDVDIKFSAQGTNGYIMGYSETSKFDVAERVFFLNENEYYFDFNLLEDQTYEGSFLGMYDKTYNATLLPGVEYTVWYVAKNDGERYDVEDVKTWSFTTQDLVMGGDLEIIASEPVVDYATIDMEFNTAGHIILYYNVVPYYEATAYSTDELAIAMLRRDGRINITTESVRMHYTGKEPGERVTLFAVAADAEGNFGKIFKQELRTKDIEYNDLKVSLEMTSEKADDLRIKVSCDGAQKYMYIVCRTADEDWKQVYGGTIKRAGNYMIINPNNYNIRHSDDPDYALVDGEIKLDGLMIDDEYVIVVVAVDENGISEGAGLYFKPMTNLGNFVAADDANWEVGKPTITVGECLNTEFFNITWYVTPQEGYTAYSAVLFPSFIEEEKINTPEKLAAYLKTNGTVCEYSADGYVHSWKEYADLDNDGTFGDDDYIYHEEETVGVYNHYFYGTKGQSMIYTTWCDSEGNFHAPFMIDPAEEGNVVTE